MNVRFEELAWRATPWGEISLRRRRDPVVDHEVYEIKLDDEFLMSSTFTVAEIELAQLALSAVADGLLDVAVGGLGLGYTAHAVLQDPRVHSLVVVEALGEVIEWHEQGLIPAGNAMVEDTRCEFVRGDFFALLRDDDGLDPRRPGRRFHAILVDIDHSPRHVLHPSHADFYTPTGLRPLADRLHPGGVFALWSNDPVDDEFMTVLATVFDDARAEVVAFHNPLQGRDAANTIYLARR